MLNGAIKIYRGRSGNVFINSVNTRDELVEWILNNVSPDKDQEDGFGNLSRAKFTDSELIRIAMRKGNVFKGLHIY